MTALSLMLLTLVYAIVNTDSVSNDNAFIVVVIFIGFYLGIKVLRIFFR